METHGAVSASQALTSVPALALGDVIAFAATFVLLFPQQHYQLLAASFELLVHVYTTSA